MKTSNQHSSLIAGNDKEIAFKTMMSPKAITVKYPSYILEAIDKLAENQLMSRSQLLRHVVFEYLRFIRETSN